MPRPRRRRCTCARRWPVVVAAEQIRAPISSKEKHELAVVGGHAVRREPHDGRAKLVKERRPGLPQDALEGDVPGRVQHLPEQRRRTVRVPARDGGRDECDDEEDRSQGQACGEETDRVTARVLDVRDREGRDRNIFICILVHDYQ